MFLIFLSENNQLVFKLDEVFFNSSISHPHTNPHPNTIFACLWGKADLYAKYIHQHQSNHGQSKRQFFCMCDGDHSVSISPEDQS